ncbi:MAG TPA: SDR family NAD(P)-dependent oxidoreductase [Ktedonobacteraceae bacterium]|nr:SDR family NAD(P)-dependent oxidoreductase [Ktedonobacteraceae bacterium]
MSTNWTLQGKTAVVTGGTGGIGLATAHGLAEQGAQVIIVGRDKTRGEEAAARLQKETGNKAIVFAQADLSSQAEIRHVAQQIVERYRQVHVLINNVGGLYAQRKLTVDGLESTLAVTHLAPFLLTHLLLPTLKECAPARIINVNSASHRSGRIDFDDLQSARNYDPMRAYSQAKLANLLVTYELARQLEGSGVSVNAADPGGAATDLARSEAMPALFRLILPLLAKIMTVERAAQSSLYFASSTEIEGVTGKYVNARKKFIRSASSSYDVSLAQRLWNVSASLTSNSNIVIRP